MKFKNKNWKQRIAIIVFCLGFFVGSLSPVYATDGSDDGRSGETPPSDEDERHNHNETAPPKTTIGDPPPEGESGG